MKNMELYTPETEVKKDTSEVNEALDEQIDAGDMDKLVSDANELVQMRKDSPEFKTRLAEVAKRAEIAKKTPMGTSPQYTKLAALLLEMGGPDVSTQMGRERLRMSTEHLYENVRNQMRAEHESFENLVNHFVNKVQEGLKDAGDQKEAILTSVLAGLAADIDHGTLSDEEKKVMKEVLARLTQAA